MVVSVILAPFLCLSYPILPQRGARGQLRGGLRARGRPLTLHRERQVTIFPPASIKAPAQATRLVVLQSTRAIL